MSNTSRIAFAGSVVFLCLANLGCVTALINSLSGEDVYQEVRTNGIPASATVLEIWETGIRINDNPVVGFRLEVNADGVGPYEAETKALISILWIPRIQPGAVLPIRYAAGDPSLVALDI